MNKLAHEASSAIAGYLDCGICLEVADQPVETTCCHNIYCEICITEAKSAKDCCPSCRRAHFQFTVNYLARRMINSMQVPCPYKCGSYLTSADLGQHKKKCGHNPYSCPDPEPEEEFEDQKPVNFNAAIYGLALAGNGVSNKLNKKGHVSGYYLQYDGRHLINGTFVLEKGKLTIKTKDNLGKAVWEGMINLYSSSITIIKRYSNTHSVEYKGKINRDMTVIKGKWKMGYLSDEFALYLEKA